MQNNFTDSALREEFNKNFDYWYDSEIGLKNAVTEHWLKVFAEYKEHLKGEIEKKAEDYGAQSDVWKGSENCTPKDYRRDGYNLAKEEFIKLISQDGTNTN